MKDVLEGLGVLDNTRSRLFEMKGEEAKRSGIRINTTGQGLVLPLSLSETFLRDSFLFIGVPGRNVDVACVDYPARGLFAGKISEDGRLRDDDIARLGEDVNRMAMMRKVACTLSIFCACRLGISRTWRLVLSYIGGGGSS